MATKTTSFSTLRPIISETNGRCLILKGVPINGKRYDIRIWKMDEEDNEIPLNDSMEFSDSACRQIQEVAKDIFGRFRDPTLAKIFYRDAPEMCEWHNDKEINDLIEGPQNDPHIVKGARKIYGLLFPVSRMEWRRDPGANLVIKPRLLSPEEITALDRVKTEPTATTEALPVETPTQAIVPSAPTATASQPSLDEITRKALDEASKTAKTFTDRNSFLEGVTHEDLARYSVQRDKKETDPLHRAYDTYKKLAQNTASKNDDCIQMKDWLQRHYKHARNARKIQEAFKDYFKSQPEGQPFDETKFKAWCRYTAANAVVNRIVAHIDLQKLIDELISPSVNISLDDD